MLKSTERRLRHRVSTLLLLSLLTAYYAFVATAGKFGVLGWNTHYYDLAAEGFRFGHLYLPIPPSPMLLAAPNPYSPVNRALWLWDTLLFDRHYYIYWGPVPALWLLLFKWLTGYREVIADQWLVLVFMLGRLYAGAALILAVSRQSPRPPRWVTLLSIAIFALASPTPFVLARPLVYEASVASGQCFLFCGLLAAYWGLQRPRHQTVWFVVAGVCFGLSLGSRVTMLLVAPFVVLFTTLVIWRRSGWRFLPAFRALLELGTPIGLSLLALGLYNQARFGSPFEFGVRFQLSGRPFATEPAFLLPNLQSYLFAELEWSCQFPFIRLPITRARWTMITWPFDYDLGGYSVGERVGGLFITTSICWLLLAYVFWLVRAGTRVFTRGPHRLEIGMSHAELWLALSTLSLAIAMGPAMLMWLASMRYLEDAAGGLLIASILAGYAMMRSAGVSRIGRVVTRGLYALLAAHTIFVGVSLGFTGHADNFIRENPALYLKLWSRLSVCSRP